MQTNDIWTVSWSMSVGGNDFETTADIQADSATFAAKKFMMMMKSRFMFDTWEGEIIRVEKNHTYFLFKVENNIIRRV